MTPWDSHHTWHFGHFVYDVSNNSLWIKDSAERISIEKKSQDLLRLLLCQAVEDPEKVIPREEVCAEVWPDLKYGPEADTIDRRVTSLRKLLQKHGDSKCIYILSVKKQGMRFAIPVKQEKPLALMLLPFRLTHGQSLSIEEAADFEYTLRGALSRRLALNPELRIHRYEGGDQNPSREKMQEIRKIGVDKLLIGSLLLSARNVRVTMEILRTDDIYESPPPPIEQEADNLLLAVEPLAERLEAALNAVLSNRARKVISGRRATNIKAQELYEFGRTAWTRHVPDGLKTAVEMYQEAIELEPTFALPYSGMAEAFFNLGAFGNEHRPPHEVMPQAEKMARKALSLDPECAEAQTILASVQMVYHWDAKTAEESFVRAIAMNPDYGQAHHFYANSITATGNFNKALEEIDIAHRLDFKDLKTASSFAWIHYFAGNYGETISRCRELIKVAPGYPLSHAFMGLAFIQVGDLSAAIKEYRKIIGMLGPWPAFISTLAFAYALSGQPKKAKEGLAQLKSLKQGRYFSPYLEAVVYLALGEKETTYKLLEATENDRSSWLTFVGVDPMLRTLHGDTRFRRLVKRVNVFHPLRLVKKLPR